MKVKHLYLLGAMMALLAAPACKKDKNEEEDPAKLELARRIQWKWQLESFEINNNFGGVDHTETTPGTAEDYVDFRTDGKMYTSFGGHKDTSAYSIEDDKRLIIDGDKAKIEKLKDNAFVLSTRDQTGSIGYVELRYRLKK